MAREIRPPPIELDPRLLLGQTVWVRSAAEKWEVAVVTKITRKRARDDSAEKWYVLVQRREGGRLCIPYMLLTIRHGKVAQLRRL